MTSSRPLALEDRASEGARLSSPSAGRNRDVIAQTLAGLLPDRTRVLEIASGTGEHALAAVLKRPDLYWTPSDPDARSRASCDDWAREAPGRITPALNLDVMQVGWWQTLPEAVNAIFCANMIHIAPWRAAEGLFEGAGALLPDGALLVLYGPFLEGGDTAPSNLAFDESLKGRNPEWGVRALDDVEALAGSHGFSLSQRIAMPANNLTLLFVKGAP
ncbi:MAG: DUF938 domain-containing protein [Oceanicaulis sp.]|uniref:DUF938 domain-containing protein n=1 Tax=Glycocaulis sp. TaxID=1969725 RepID=UPI0025C0E794|nr:DUF938 domain-containing protein [Glycocaulis sp.]MCC5981579.1 DUF938 domain-containing protein [Oceanicaulis sp.]MCH8522214.1 class I SAM-dependent methyltransferase [Glycocaulis sp.]